MSLRDLLKSGVTEQVVLHETDDEDADGNRIPWTTFEPEATYDAVESAVLDWLDEHGSHLAGMLRTEITMRKSEEARQREADRQRIASQADLYQPSSRQHPDWQQQDGSWRYRGRINPRHGRH